MFCSKCGTQLPDGAMFCGTCGNQINVQPAAPVMPVEPVAPVLETPVIETPVMEAPVMEAPVMEAPVMEAPVMETPVMGTPVMETPVMGTPMMEAPMMNNQAYDPNAQYAYNNVPNDNIAYNNMTYDNNMAYNMPVSAPVNPAPKKSKAPLFIGLGIAALVIAIIAIVLILVFTGDDKKKNSKKSNSTTEATTEEITTEEETTEEPTTEVVVDYDDAENVATKFMNAIDASNFSKAARYMFPAMLEFFKDEGYSSDDVVESFLMTFQDSDGDLLDYEITSVKIDDSDNFDEFCETAKDSGYDLGDYSSYTVPTHFAIAEVEFTYEDQSSCVYLYLAYADGSFYVFDYNDDDFDIKLEEESSTEPESESTPAEEFNFESSLEKNFNSVDITVDGTKKQLDGHTLTIPNTWTVTDSNCMSPDFKNFVTFSKAQPVTPETKMLVLSTLCDTYINMGFQNFKFGNLSANGKQGYFIEGDYMGAHTYIFMYFNTNVDKMFLAVVTSEDANSDDYLDALGIAASLEIQ